MRNNARQQFIIDSIKFFIKNYPQEWGAAKKRVKEMRATRATPFGSDKEKEFRFEFTIPARLFAILDKVLVNPKFLADKKEADWFARTIKSLNVPEKW